MIGRPQVVARTHARVMLVVGGLGCASCRVPEPAPGIAVTSAVLAVGAGVIGTHHPYELIAVSPDGRWSVVCQARADTDHDGKVAVSYAQHGEQAGDRMIAYLTDPSGRETVIDNFLGQDPSGRWLAVVEHGSPVLIDASSWRRTPLVGTLPRFRITSGRADWSFSPGGGQLLYMRDGAAIVRELEAGTERVIAPVAWQASWSHDGAWVELHTLGGDTNHDGYTHGPDLAPHSAIGRNCGHKVDWGDRVLELDPTASTVAQVDAAIESVEHPDDLTGSLWRARDGRVMPGERAIDGEAIVTHRVDGSLAVGVPGGRERIVPAGCVIASVFVPTTSLVLTCTLPGREYAVRWWRGDVELELYRGAIEPTILGEDSGFFEIWTRPHAAFHDATTGRVVARRDRTHLTWSDDEHLLIRPEEDPSQEDPSLELFIRGRRGSVTASGAIGTIEVLPGRYLVVGTRRFDLHMFGAIDLPGLPVAIRTDGAVLLDAGPESSDPSVHVRLGPLRWTSVPAGS